MRQKLKKTEGETLIEVLASILIGALSVALLFSAVLASARIDRSAEDADGAFRVSLRAAEKQAEALTDGAMITVESRVPVVVEPSKLPVIFFGGKGAVSYALPADEGGGTP